MAPEVSQKFTAAEAITQKQRLALVEKKFRVKVDGVEFPNEITLTRNFEESNPNVDKIRKAFREVLIEVGIDPID